MNAYSSKMANLNINDSPDSGKRIMTHAHQGLKRLTGHSKSHVLHIFPYMNIPEKRVLSRTLSCTLRSLCKWRDIKCLAKVNS